MNKKYRISLFIFRRDLRIHDNTGLNAALSQSKLVIPCFIFNPEQVGPENQYRSLNAIQFMLQSLDDLNQELIKKGSHLYLFYGKPEEIVSQLLASNHLSTVFVNKDYTPYSTQRDRNLKELCMSQGIDFLSFDDALLHAPGTLVNAQGKPYEIFTPFFKKSSSLAIQKPLSPDHHAYYTKKIPGEIDAYTLQAILPNERSLYTTGGRKNALAILAHSSRFKNYAQTHDFPAYDTTLLSPHNKFGTVSIREVYYSLVEALSEHHPLIRQLYWRDFFCHIACRYPQVFGHAFHEKFDHLPWSTNKSHFKRWCDGTTGFPIVDAGMRQLNETGFMHNRARLIVASFLVKDLHINWQWGEKYFAQQLTDYDPAVNNGNWQWIASTGCDHQPYFRIFNPWVQQKRFDPDCIYIKKWVPELKNVDPKSLHSWHKQTSILNGYPAPMLDHSKEAAIAKDIYTKAIARKT